MSGFCLKCRRKQDRFFGCPQNQGDAQRQLFSSTADPSRGTPGEIQWDMFTTVDERGNATNSNARSGRGRRQGDDPDGDDDDWDPRGGADKPRLRKAVVLKKGTVDELFKEFKEILLRYIKHRRQYHTQRSAFQEMLATLEEGNIILVVDFQERLSIREQDEVQSQLWDHVATTIFPCPIFIKWRGRVWAYLFQVLSDDMSQDNAWVQYAMAKLLSEDIPALLREMGAPCMTRATIFTDNCGKQFKCSFTLAGWQTAG